MEEGIYRVLIYEPGQSIDPGSEVARIDYFAFSNYGEGIGVGIGVFPKRTFPKDLEEKSFRIIDPERDRRYFQISHLIFINLQSPLEEIDEVSAAGLISFYDFNATNHLQKEKGITTKQTEARSVTMEKIRSLDSLCA